MSKKIILLLVGCSVLLAGSAQTAADLLQGVKAKADKVKDYEATGKMKTNVSFIKAPEADVKVYFKKPDKLKIKNIHGISFIPEGSYNINLETIFSNTAAYDVLDAGTETGTNYRVIKLLPKDDNAMIVLSTLYIDSKNVLVKKVKTTTKENGTYELSMEYGKYADYGLADKVTFSFNTKEYKLPKGVTFDYDDGTQKKKETSATSANKGEVQISYSSYVINKGVPDSVFK